MALTTCTDCEGKVSTNAEACPHCGAPVVTVEPHLTKFVKHKKCRGCGRRLKKVPNAEGLRSGETTWLIDMSRWRPVCQSCGTDNRTYSEPEDPELRGVDRFLGPPTSNDE